MIPRENTGVSSSVQPGELERPIYNRKHLIEGTGYTRCGQLYTGVYGAVKQPEIGETEGCHHPEAGGTKRHTWSPGAGATAGSWATGKTQLL